MGMSTKDNGFKDKSKEKGPCSMPMEINMKVYGNKINKQEKEPTSKMGNPIAKESGFMDNFKKGKFIQNSIKDNGKKGQETEKEFMSLMMEAHMKGNG